MNNIESEVTSIAAESDDQDGHTPNVLASSASESGGFGGKDISRRFERQSWRERHAEERRRLKLRFEVMAIEFLFQFLFQFGWNLFVCSLATEGGVRAAHSRVGRRADPAGEGTERDAAADGGRGRGAEGGGREAATTLHPFAPFFISDEI